MLLAQPQNPRDSNDPEPQDQTSKYAAQPRFGASPCSGPGKIVEYIGIGTLSNEHFVEGEEEDEELQWLLKRPINICQFVITPFFEGEAEFQNSAVCAANIHRQKNGGLERT